MRRITTLDSSPNQSIYFVTEEGKNIHLTLSFKPRQQAWFLDLESDTFNVYGLQICCSPNILDKFHNIIEYGIQITTLDGYDPWRVDDFETGYCSFCILNKNELKQTTEFLNGE